MIEKKRKKEKEEFNTVDSNDTDFLLYIIFIIALFHPDTNNNDNFVSVPLNKLPRN